MKDLTEQAIARHIVQMALPIAAGMFFQTLYFLIDLYFVARLGDTAIAGVGTAGNVMFLVFSLTQVLGVGSVALISQAVGAKNRVEATVVFNQCLLLAFSCMLLTLAVGYAATPFYMATLSADAATRQSGITYLQWFLPNLALQFGLVVMGSALRATGIVKPSMVVQVLTVLINAILAPVLIAGWGTGRPLGVMGAGLSSSLAMGVGVVLLALYFRRLEHYVVFDFTLWRPRLAVWRRVLRVGLPAGGEFLLMFLFMVLVYWLLRRFGPEAQAGYGVGQRMMQCLFLPAMAVAFAAAPIVGQNYGAQRFDRVRDTYKIASWTGIAIMALLTVTCQLGAPHIIGVFTKQPAALALGSQFLQIISWNFIASGYIFTCSAVFQGLGNTMPAVLSSLARMVLFTLIALWLAARPGFSPAQLWYASLFSMTVQALLSFWFMRRQFSRFPAPTV